MKAEITYNNGLADAARAIEAKMPEIIRAAAETVSESAKSRCPVDTGRLRASISVTESDENSARVSAETDYAAYVEFGTAFMAPQPYLVPSLISDKEKVIGTIAAAVEGVTYD